MRGLGRKHLIGGLLIAGALTYLGIAAAGSGWVYFVDVDQYMRSAPKAGERTRLHGMVAAPLDARPAALTASFTLAGAASSLPVEYRGVIPESLATGRQVVVEGAIDGRGVFVADVLLTKCASKYDAAGAHHVEERP